MIPTWSQTMEYMGLRKKSYQVLFGKSGVMGEEAMKDLARFCYAAKSTSVPNGELSRSLQGRREVWLRICEHLNLEPEELAAIYGAVTVDQRGEQ